MKSLIKNLLFLIAIVAGTLYANNLLSRKPTQLSCDNCNVVVMLIDTLRADRLPTYGHNRDTAPFLTALMDESIVFERAFSASSWTAPATASVFTSLNPSEHGIITGFVATKAMMKRGHPIKMNRLSDDHEVMGETMKKAGFTTIAVTDNLNIGTEMGFDRGFDYFKTLKEKGSHSVNMVANEFLKKAKTDKPYFLYLHYMDPHAPYIQHKPWYETCVKDTDKSVKESMLCAYDSEIRYLDANIAEMFKQDKRSVIQDRDHYILTQEPQKKDQHELYDLEYDFAEQYNLATERYQSVNKLQNTFSLLPDVNDVQRNPSVDVEMNEELFEKLKTLGYIS